jgi:hypothetical protein
VELLGLPRLREGLHELLGHLELAGVGLDVRGVRHLVEGVGRDHLVVEDHRAHGQDVADRAQRDELLLGADDHLRDADPAGLAHGVDQEPVGLGAARARHEVVRVVEVDRVDLRELDEALDVDRLGLARVQALELAGLQDHVAVRAISKPFTMRS